MKLCPQCEFLYEDDQVFCDMDGEGLVYDTSARVFPGDGASATRARSPISRLTAVVVVAGILLSTLLSFAFYASWPSRDSNLISQSRKPETSQSQQIAAPPDNSSTQPVANPSQSPPNPDAASESAELAAGELADRPVSQSARNQTASRATENSVKVSDKRLTIARRLPALPELTPLPRLPPLKRLPAAKPDAKVRVTTAPEKEDLTKQKSATTSQKALVLEVKPASGNSTKRSKVRAFLKKTGHILKKPFQL